MIDFSDSEKIQLKSLSTQMKNIAKKTYSNHPIVEHLKFWSELLDREFRREESD